MRWAGIILLCVGMLKLITAFSQVRYLAYPDPVLEVVTNRFVLLFAGGLEVLIGGCAIGWPNSWTARHSLLALCISFMVYRCGRLFLIDPPPCPCLGRAADWLHLKPQQVDAITLILLMVLLIISVISIWRSGLEPASNRI